MWSSSHIVMPEASTNVWGKQQKVLVLQKEQNG
jgi:hypothetical protein